MGRGKHTYGTWYTWFACGAGHHQGLLTLLRWTALLVKIRSDATEPEGFGGSKVEGENKV
jgi:hypothetical protein